MADSSQGQRVAVIGAGVGGLACAALLARAGLDVTLFEKNARVGGKLGWLEIDGYTWDTGPSLLTMPHVFERLWQRLGRQLRDDLTLVPLPVTCRYRWPDGTCIDEDAAFWQRPDVARFIEYARGIYELSADLFLHRPPGDWWRGLSAQTLRALRHLPKIATRRTMHAVAREFFGHDPHLVQLFDRFATYNGSSPFLTPAAFHIIPFVEAHFDGWYVRGGLFEIALALERICRAGGVRLCFDTEVRGAEIHRSGVGAREQFTLCADPTAPRGPFDFVVCNQDALSATMRFLPAAHAARFARTQLARQTPSTSAFLLFLGVARSYPQLAHHNIFFSSDYPQEFEQLFTHRTPADEPTIYVAVHSKADPLRAPPGCENWFVLVNAPALSEDGRTDWAAMAEAYGDTIIERLETTFGLSGLRAALRVRRHFTPADFQTRDLAHAGSLYGFASHGIRAAFQRPPLQPRGLRNWFFVGGTTHPGGGLPLVCLSAEMVADKILARCGARMKP